MDEEHGNIQENRVNAQESSAPLQTLQNQQGRWPGSRGGERACLSRDNESRQPSRGAPRVQRRPGKGRSHGVAAVGCGGPGRVCGFSPLGLPGAAEGVNLRPRLAGTGRPARRGAAPGNG